MNVEFVEGLQQSAEGCAFGHLGEGVHVLRETLAAVAQFAVGAGYIGVGVVDIT